MSHTHVIHRKDNNAGDLIAIAERLGWWLRKANDDGDYWGYRHGKWFPIEIKNPSKMGHADEFTPRQVIFHRDCQTRGAPILIWRFPEDVYRASNARVSA